MRSAITREFGERKPRAIVLDDNARARQMTARRLRGRGFDVEECGSVGEFRECWVPGTVDVIVSDWDLSNEPDEEGDKILAQVRTRDWDVPFVLVSGKLAQAEERACVLEALLGSGGAAFVQRGTNGIAEACNLAEDLIERRDLALLKVILALRPAAIADVAITVSTGEVRARSALEEIVSRPSHSHDAGRPIALARLKHALSER